MSYMQMVSVSTVTFAVAIRIPHQQREKGMGALKVKSTPPGSWVTLAKGTGYKNRGIAV